MIYRENMDVIAAHAMLLTLKGSLGTAEGDCRFRFEPGAPKDVDCDSAIATLVSLPKPVCCGISFVDGIPTISWRHVSETDLQEPLAREFSLLGRAPNGRVLLIAGGAEFVIPAEALRAWRRDYRISTPYTMTADAPTEEEPADGVVWVLRVYEGADMTFFDEGQEPLPLPQELRSRLPADG